MRNSRRTHKAWPMRALPFRTKKMRRNAMNLKLLPVLCVLCLTACGTRLVKDDSPASDLDVLGANVSKDGKRVILPNGKEYCFELSRNEDEQDDCTGDLEDALFNANERGERQVKIVERFAARERLRRNPCSFWEKLRRVDRCRPDKIKLP